MNKKALIAVCIAVLIPVVCYMWVRSAGEDAVSVPRRYLPDSVINNVVSGKMVTDTIWHKVADIQLQNQLGDTVNLFDKQGKIIVADFIFTSCGLVCPKLTHNMVKMQQSFLKGGNPNKKADSSIVQFVSFTIDPERDSVPRLKAYADRNGADHDNWWFLTGAKDSIYNFIFQELKVDKYETDGPLDPDFAHTQRFVLIDKARNIRGFYNGLDTASISQLSKDIGVLMLEKSTNPQQLPFDPVQMAVFFAIALVIVIIMILVLFKRKPIE